MVPILVILTFVVIVAVTAFMRTRRSSVPEAGQMRPSNVMNRLLFPLNYLLFGNHVWLKKVTEQTYTLGIDEFLNNFVGTLDQIYLKNKGDLIKKGEQLTVLKKGKREIYVQSPVSGIIEKVNDVMSIQPHVVESDPYDHGWLYTLSEYSPKDDRSDAKTGQAAKSWLNSEFIRLKEFLQLHNQHSVPVVETLMDGGWPVSGVIDYLDQNTLTLFEQDFLKYDEKSSDS